MAAGLFFALVVVCAFVPLLEARTERHIGHRLQPFTWPGPVPDRHVPDGPLPTGDGDDPAIPGARRGDSVVREVSLSGTTPRLVAQATLAALRRLDPAAESMDVETATIVGLGGHRVAVVALVAVFAGHEQLLVGSAMAGPGGEHDALARAVIQAMDTRPWATA